MLIQITNRCRMGCPHCMEDGRPDGRHMDSAMFDKALAFSLAVSANVVVVGGAEPTEHLLFLDFCKKVSDAGLLFTICSNGMWLGDAAKERDVESLASLPGYTGMQVYSNPKYYRLFNEIVAAYRRNEARWAAAKAILDTSPIINMNDLGRAARCPAALEEMARHRYHQPCLTAHLAARQTGSFRDFCAVMCAQGHFCTPMIDIDGGFHASEAWMCQSFGNVATDSPDAVWERFRASRPCCKCALGRRFLEEQTPKMAAVRKILGFNKEGDE